MPDCYCPNLLAYGPTFLQTLPSPLFLQRYQDRKAISAIVLCDQTLPTLPQPQVLQSSLHVPLCCLCPDRDEANSPAMPIEEYLSAQVECPNIADHKAPYHHCMPLCLLLSQGEHMER